MTANSDAPSSPRAFVIGHPIAHSRSPLIHGYWLEQFGIDGSYEALNVRPDDITLFLREGVRNFVGGNVTLPHKETVFRLADEVSDVARRLGAVNTIRIDPDGRIFGHNTDVEGYTEGVAAAVGADWVEGVARALVLGAGGSARAVVAALIDRGVGRVQIAARNLGAAERLSALAPTRTEIVSFSEVERHLPAVDLLVNTTPLGMTGQMPLDLPIDGLPANAIVSDIVYAPLDTPLLARAAARGLRTVDGLRMLLHQAVPGFAMWFGTRPTVTSELRARIVADLARA